MKINTQDGDSSFEEIEGDEDDVEEIKFNLTASMQEEKPNPAPKKQSDEIMMIEEISKKEEEKKPEKMIEEKPSKKDGPCPLSEKAMAKLIQWKEFTKLGKVTIFLFFAMRNFCVNSRSPNDRGLSI